MAGEDVADLGEGEECEKVVLFTLVGLDGEFVPFLVENPGLQLV